MRRKLKVVKFPKAKRDPDSTFIRTLVWVLDRARAGKVRGFALTCMIDDADAGDTTIEAAQSFEKRDRLHMLGAMRRMELNFVKRHWTDDENPNPIPFED